MLKNINLLLVSLPPDIYPPVVPPTITQQPSDQLNVVPGSTVRFTVTATTDFGTLTYKWQRDDADLDPLPDGVSGETTNTLTITSFQERHKGMYTCIVSNAVGESTSKPAQLTIRKYHLHFARYPAIHAPCRPVCVFKNDATF